MMKPILPTILTFIMLTGCVGVGKDDICDTSSGSVEVEIDQPESWLGVTDTYVGSAYHVAALTWPAELDADEGEDTGTTDLREDVAVTAYRCLDGEAAPAGCSITSASIDGGRVQVRLGTGEYAVVLMSWYEDAAEIPSTPYLDELLFSDDCEVQQDGDCIATLPDVDGATHDSPLAVGIYAGAGLIGGEEPLDAAATYVAEEGWHVVVSDASAEADVRAVIGWRYEPAIDSDCETKSTRPPFMME